jgi:predicted component of type VI protein secretion system
LYTPSYYCQEVLPSRICPDRLRSGQTRDRIFIYDFIESNPGYQALDPPVARVFEILLAARACPFHLTQGMAGFDRSTVHAQHFLQRPFITDVRG